jgi:hypothetical protein
MVRFALPVLAIAVLVAGCGGGHSRKPRLSKATFVKETNRICANATTRSGRLARLRALRPPKADEDLYAKWLKAEKDANDAIEPAKQPPSEPVFDPGIPLVIAEGKVAGYARRLGATECAKRAIGTMPP